MAAKPKSPEVWAVMAHGWALLAFVAAVLLGSWIRANADVDFSMGVVWLVGVFVAGLTLLVNGDSRRTAQEAAARDADDARDADRRP